MRDPFLIRQWLTTGQVAAGLDLSSAGVRRRLERLSAAGLVERSMRGDGAQLWRLAPEFADLVSRGAKR